MSQIDHLPPLREVIARHDLRAIRSLGQNFLLDLNLTARIARAAGELQGVTVIEVGPGPGGLTRALLAAGAKRVIAIERDRRCVLALAEIAAYYPDRLSIVEADALAVDMAGSQMARRGLSRTCHSISQPPLLDRLATRPNRGHRTTSAWSFMFQKEVAERIVGRSRIQGRMAGYRRA
jgi:16S rRNA (adenine1518-N6/adenine1519-N6)-dimethyltransferase